MYAYDQEQQNINGVNDDFSATDSVPSNLLKNKQPRSKGNRCYTIERVLNKKWHDGKIYKTVKINMYGSGDYGSYIRNAVTGVYSNHRVGSRAENLYYSVANCCGVDKINGPVHLYYDTPSQYEAHQFTTVDHEVKEAWLTRVNLLKDTYV
jgi:hypothetical protein